MIPTKTIPTKMIPTTQVGENFRQGPSGARWGRMGAIGAILGHMGHMAPGEVLYLNAWVVPKHVIIDLKLRSRCV